MDHRSGYNPTSLRIAAADFQPLICFFTRHRFGSGRKFFHVSKVQRACTLSGL